MAKSPEAKEPLTPPKPQIQRPWNRPVRGQSEQEKGFVCRKCGCRDFWVNSTRPVAGRVRRLRECRNCGHTIVTFELPQSEM